jgi:hypothetical protein
MNDELMLRRVDVRQAGMRDGEEQPVGRHRALQQVVRRTRVRIAEFIIRIAESTDHVFLEARRDLIRRHDRAHFQAPRIVLERLSCCARESRASGHRAGEHRSAAQKCATIKQAITGNRNKGRSHRTMVASWHVTYP